MQETQAYTLDDVASLTAELDTIRSELADARSEAEEAGRAARTNPRDQKAIRRKVEAAARVEAYGGRIVDLQREIAEAQEVAYQGEAERRILGVVRGHGSLMDQRTKDIQRLQAAAASVVEAVNRLNRRHADLEGLICEALVLAERFGLDMPDLARPLSPARDAAVKDALKAARSATAVEAEPLPSKLTTLPARGAGWTLWRLTSRLAGTPTGELLQQAGGGVLASADAWEAHRLRVQNEARTRNDAAHRAEVDRYDSWLRDFLTDGPQQLEEIERAARDAGLRTRRDRNANGLSVREAAERLGVVGLLEKLDGPAWWALPDTWDMQRFVRMSEATTLSVMRR
jgi:hypothetical protein